MTMKLNILASGSECQIYNFWDTLYMALTVLFIDNNCELWMPFHSEASGHFLSQQ